MTITVNGSPLTLDIDQVLLWMVVGLVAGFLASHLALGHGLGLIWDIIVGILGALFGGIVLAGELPFNTALARRPVVLARGRAVIRAPTPLMRGRPVSGRRYPRGPL